jgi:hypothetical protein
MRFSRRREDGRPPLNGVIMRLKNLDHTEREQRPRAVASPLLQEDKTVRAALLFIVIFGVATLVGVVVYLAGPYSIPGL